MSKHDADNLQKSIDKFGLIDKPIVTHDGLIIGGHQRVSILKKMGHKEVECYVADSELNEKDIEELNIRLNRNRGEWDFDILANQWESTELLDYGFSADELVITVDPQGDTDPDGDIISTTKDAKTKLGDLYELGNHRLICGDSTLPDCVDQLLIGEVPILMVTDPPYGVEYDASWREGIKGKRGKGHLATGKVQNDDKVNWSLAWHLFPGSVAYIWHASKFCSEVQKSLEEAEYEIVNQIIWVKQHFALSRGDYHWQHEPCWYAVKKGNAHNWQGSRNQSTIWEISNLNAFGKNNEDERTCHSTQKPLECMSRPIANNSCEAEGVYDPFLGSGTTLLACEKLNRKCFGIELDPSYCDVIIDRWINYRKKMGKDFSFKKNGEFVIEW